MTFILGPKFDYFMKQDIDPIHLMCMIHSINLG